MHLQTAVLYDTMHMHQGCLSITLVCLQNGGAAATLLLTLHRCIGINTLYGVITELPLSHHKAATLS